MSAEARIRLEAVATGAQLATVYGPVVPGGADPFRQDLALILAASPALDEIADERRRQIEVEGWSLEHDDSHVSGEMADAAAVYATGRQFADDRGQLTAVGALWPWSPVWFKPRGRRRDLVKAGALIVAEIERLDRAAQGAAQHASHP